MHYRLFYAPEMEEARSKGKLKPNSFVRFEKRLVAGQLTLKIDDFGARKDVTEEQRLHQRKCSNLSGKAYSEQGARAAGLSSTSLRSGNWSGSVELVLARTAISFTTVTSS
jgi:hypothetical protein